jgi:CDP-diacylglycerol--serine O-phosphatidyltransferase
MNQLIPNALTVGALCAGLTAIRFALMGKWELAVFAIVVAGIFDGLDGRMARLLGGTSKFGAELDSLSDFVSFGVAPPVIVYLWSVNQIGSLGWAVAMLFAVCCALRLARFNTALTDVAPPHYTRHYFIGVPAPAGAGLAMLPMILSFEAGPGIFDRPYVGAIVLVVTGVLMVSRVPTFSIKRVRITQDYMVPALLLFGLLMTALGSAPWVTFICIGVVYILSIPVSVLTFFRARAAFQATSGGSAAAAMPPPALPAAGVAEEGVHETARKSGDHSPAA